MSLSRAAFCLLVLMMAATEPALAQQRERPRLSPRLKEELFHTVPPFAPRPAEAKPESEKPVDPDVVVLPKVVVQEKPLPRITPDELLTPKGRTEKLLAERSSPLDRALNRFRIPIITMSPEQRVNWEYNLNRDWSRRYELLSLEKADKEKEAAPPAPGN
jgi:hypothetical protein